MDAKLSLYALAHWMEDNGHDLFSKLVLPTGIDKDALVDNILIRSAEMSCVYQEPFFTENAIGVWSKKWNRTLIKWVSALAIEYSPLENYDRMETYTDTNTSTDSVNGSTSSTESGTGNTTGDVKNNRAAYDSSTYTPVDDTASSGSSTTSATGSTTAESESSHNMTMQHTARLHGNIGVTTSQQMLQSELDIARFNLIEQITDVFMQEFCILVY